MDAGLACLSMHQPWASLLVYGIKRIEGRTWDSNHRGRLWIHAASKEPDPEEVAQLHAFYTTVHGLEGRTPAFPPAYPTGVLVGCVEVVDVLPSAAVEGWPGLPESLKMEAGSPFCFLCQAPKRLVVPQQLPGQHKLWQLPRSVAKIALSQGLRDPPGVAPLDWQAFGDPRAMLSPAPARLPAAAAKGLSKAGSRRAEGDGDGGRAPLAAEAAPAAAAASQNTREQALAEAGGGGEEDVQKRLRAVRKKLRQVEELQAVEEAGGCLSAEQRSKVDRGQEWRRELAQLEVAVAAAGL
ncbi:hypothetical protein HYH03_013172 [Edaphochlamys debaryana]|uniref:ASCH domain-containing protein n=1 Tax=Edaphochlamys debaryana TaxID=47281 RepID=A0A836BTQ3_9CHLO|nr:hypothetical protein HYH03_013172 [Edaphochlamys debaryana]|eukprot:KAG2488322.1 hypothetical protein HYH03_013172 [Edaphochlamys debaryana]